MSSTISSITAAFSVLFTCLLSLCLENEERPHEGGRRRHGRGGGRWLSRAPPAPDLRRPGVSGRAVEVSGRAYAAAGSSSWSRTRLGSTLIPGPIVEVSVTERR